MEHFYLAGSFHCVPLSTFCTVGYYASLCLDLARCSSPKHSRWLQLCIVFRCQPFLHICSYIIKHNFKKQFVQMTRAFSFTEETKLRQTFTEAATQLTAFAEATQHTKRGKTWSHLIISGLPMTRSLRVFDAQEPKFTPFKFVPCVELTL